MSISKKSAGRAVLLQDSGELGNRLVSYSYLLAFSAEHRMSVTNLCFWRYGHLFDRPNSFVERAWLDAQDGVGSSQGKRAGEKILAKILHLPGFRFIRRRFEFDGCLVCSPRALFRRLLAAAAARLSGPITAIAGRMGLKFRKESEWEHQCSLLVSRDFASVPFASQDLVVKHAALIRSHFRLADPLREKLDQYFLPLRKRYQRIVGIHIRRGDYGRYRDGQWYFDNATYRALIVHIASLFPGEAVGFVIATNEPFPSEDFTGLDVHPAPGHLALDMYALSCCDLIAGPPSTFSGWASFVGETPIYFLQDRKSLPLRGELDEIWTPRFY